MEYFMYATKFFPGLLSKQLSELSSTLWFPIKLLHMQE